MTHTSMKISESARDRLRTLAEERGLSTRAYVEQVIAATPTEAERTERAARASLGYVRANQRVDLTENDVHEAQEWRAAIVAGEVGERR